MGLSNSKALSLTLQRNLNEQVSSLSDVYARLSSGQRIVKPSDDAAGLAVAAALTNDRRVFGQGLRNINDGVSLLNVADSTVSELSDIVVRIRELATQSANGTLSSSQRKALDTEAQALGKEYSRIAKGTEFNGQYLLDGSVQDLRLQGGYGTSGGISSNLGGVMGDGTFGGSTSYYASGGADKENRGVVFKDLNNDGILDMISAGSTDAATGYATVRLGAGDGTFGAATTYTSDTKISYGVSVADLNNDGIADMVTAGEATAGGGSATIRLGIGDGTFGAAISYTTETARSFAVAVQDLNGDGIGDLVTAGLGASNATTVRLGNGDGTFKNATSYTGGGGGDYAVTIGDVNNDGIQDLVTGGIYTGMIGYAAVRLGRGDGTFGTQTTYAEEPQECHGVALGDLNGDGILDLVTTGQGAGVGSSTVQLGLGNGTFGASSLYTPEVKSSWAVALGDLNGDGKLDMVTAGYDGTDTGYGTVRMGNGDGTFATATSYLAGSSKAFAVALGDLNGDGVFDQVVGGRAVSQDAYATIRLGNSRFGTAPLLPFSLTTTLDARWAMSAMDRKLNQLTAQRGTLGAFQSRLSSALNTLGAMGENYAAAASRITDIDVAQETTNMTRLSILQHSSVALLAQANQQPDLVTLLLS